MRSRTAIDGDGLDIFKRSHRGLRHLDLDLITHTGFGIAPIVGSNEATRSGCRNDRCAHIIGTGAKLARKHPVYVTAHRWIAPRLFQFDVPQFLYLYEF